MNAFDLLELVSCDTGSVDLDVPGRVLVMEGAEWLLKAGFATIRMVPFEWITSVRTPEADANAALNDVLCHGIRLAYGDATPPSMKIGKLYVRQPWAMNARGGGKVNIFGRYGAAIYMPGAP